MSTIEGVVLLWKISATSKRDSKIHGVCLEFGNNIFVESNVLN